MAIEKKSATVGAHDSILKGMLLDKVMKETGIEPSDESYDIAKKGVEVFLSEIISSSRHELCVEKALVDQVIAEIDQKIGTQLDGILHHERLQEMESAWRGLKPFVDRTSSLHWERLIPLVGLLGMRIGSAWELEQVISIYFGLPNVSVEQYIATQIDVDRQQLNKIGIANTQLGVDISLGDGEKDCSGKFRVCIGPLDLADYKSFLPKGNNYDALQELVLLTKGDPVQFETKLTLRSNQLPKCNISNSNILKKNGVQLGITTWIGKPSDRDVSVLSNLGRK